MTIAEMNSVISAIDGAVLCRSKTMGNFIAVPNADGGYIAVKVSALLNKDTENHKAFNVEQAMAEYKTFAEAQEAKANTPKKSKGANEEAVARRAELDAKVTEFAKGMEQGKQYTATDVMNAMPNVFKTIMECGSTLIRVAEQGALVKTIGEKGKKFYAKA